MSRIEEFQEEVQKRVSAAIYSVIAINNIARVQIYDFIDKITELPMYKHEIKKLCRELESVDNRSETIFRQRVPERAYRYKIADLGIALAEEMKTQILRQRVATQNLLGKYVKDYDTRDMMTDLIMSLMFVDLAVSVLNAKIRNVDRACRVINAEKTLMPFGLKRHQAIIEKIVKHVFKGYPDIDVAHDDSCMIGAKSIMNCIMDNDMIYRAIKKAKLNEENTEQE